MLTSFDRFTVTSRADTIFKMEDVRIKEGECFGTDSVRLDCLEKAEEGFGWLFIKILMGKIGLKI